LRIIALVIYRPVVSAVKMRRRVVRCGILLMTLELQKYPPTRTESVYLTKSIPNESIIITAANVKTMIVGHISTIRGHINVDASINPFLVA
jgi:hypothetical protein